MGKTKRKNSDIDETHKPTFSRHYSARLTDPPLPDKPVLVASDDEETEQYPLDQTP